MNNLSKQIPKKITDKSEGAAYSFLFHCDICGSPHCSLPYPSESGKPGAEERAAALERAKAEVRRFFNRCPFCGKVVCGSCYTIIDGWDMCKECAASNKKFDTG